MSGEDPSQETYEPRPGCLAVSLEEVHALAPLELDRARALWVIGDDDSPLHQVSAVDFLPTGDVLVMQDVGRTFRVYDASSGALVTHVGSVGDGPGEFTQVFFSNISSQGHITLADYQNGRFVQFLPDFSPGEVVSMAGADTRTRLRGITDNGTILKSVRAPLSSRTLAGEIVVQEDWEYLLADYEDAQTDTILRTIEYTARLNNRIMSGPSSAPSGGVGIAGPWVAFVEPDGRSISIVNTSDRSAVCISPGGDAALFASDSPEVDERVDSAVTRELSPLAQALQDVYPAPLGLPLVDRMLLTPSGYPLVYLGRRFRDTPAGFEDIVQLDPSGRPLFRLQVQSPTRPFVGLRAVSENRLVLFWYDEFDIEYLGVFSVP